MPLPDIEPTSLGMGMISNNKTPMSGGLFDGLGGEEAQTNEPSSIGEMFKNSPLGNSLDFDSVEDEEENKKFEKLEIDKIEIKTAEIGKLIVDSLVTKDEEEKSTVEEQEEDKKSEMAEKILPSLVEESKEIPDILGDSSNEPKTAIDKETQSDTTNPPSTILEPMVSETPEETATVLEPMVSETATVLESMVSETPEETPEETATVLEPMVSKDALEEDKTKTTEEQPGIMDWALNPIGNGMDMLFGDDEETAVTDGQMQKEQPTEEKPGIMDTLWDHSLLGMVSDTFKGDDEETAVTDGQMQKEQPTEEKPGIMDWALNPIGTGMDMLFGDDEKSTPEDDTYDVLIDIRDIISEFDLYGGSDVSENLLEETITPSTEETAWGFSEKDLSGGSDVSENLLEETITPSTEETAWGFSEKDLMNDAMMPVANLENNTENIESQTKTIEENVELKTIENAQVTTQSNISDAENKRDGSSSFPTQPTKNTKTTGDKPGPKYTKNPPPPIPPGKSSSEELQTYITIPQWRRMLG